MKYRYYRIPLTQDALNALADLGFEIVSKDPLLIGKHFAITEYAATKSPFRSMLEYVDRLCNTPKNGGIVPTQAECDQNQSALMECGFTFSFDPETKKVKVSPACIGMIGWRLEINAESFIGEDDEETNAPFAAIYLTMGDYRLNFPAFINKDDVDSSTPSDILAKLASCPFISVGEGEEEEQAQPRTTGAEA